MVSYSVILFSFLDLMHCLHLQVFALIIPYPMCIYIFIYLTVYGNTGVTHSDPNAITKRLFPARVREMHRNGNEGFEEEFQVRLK